MADLNLSPYSRFQETEVVEKDGNTTFGLWNRPDFLDISKLNKDEVVTVYVDNKYAGKPDVISYDLYDTPKLEWVIIMSNRPRDTVGFPKAGTILKVPSREVVLRGI
jgi:hypothetical protein